MPVAVAIGADPATMYSAILPLPPEIDEMLFAGFLRGKPVEMVKCETSDLEVPANSEIVLEGYRELGEMRREGPFGDHTGFYSLDDDYPVFHVECITHRKDPIYAATIVGPPPMEDFYMGKAIERIFLPLMRMQLPEVRDICMPAEGVFHNLILVSIRKSYPGQARKVMHAIWGLGQAMFSKCIVVVDEDVDVQNVQRGLLEGPEQHRPAAGHRVRDGPGRFAGPRQPVAELRIEDGRGRHHQMAFGRLYAPLAERDSTCRPSGQAAWTNFGNARDCTRTLRNGSRPFPGNGGASLLRRPSPAGPILLGQYPKHVQRWLVFSHGRRRRHRTN